MSEHFSIGKLSNKSVAYIPRWRKAPAKHTDLLNERHLHFFSLLKFAFVAIFFLDLNVIQLLVFLFFFFGLFIYHNTLHKEGNVMRYLIKNCTAYDIVCGKVSI